MLGGISICKIELIVKYVSLKSKDKLTNPRPH